MISEKTYTREWIESDYISSDNKIYSVTQIYTWLISRDKKFIIVSKDNNNWQFPGGHPEKKEAFNEYNNEVILHDDLHTENMLFEANHLTAVLDFGDTNIGCPEQELRQLYRINELILQSAIEQYSKLCGKSLDIEKSKVWAIMQELAVFSENLNAEDFSHHSFDRSSRNLNKWYPYGQWGKDKLLNFNMSLQ